MMFEKSHDLLAPTHPWWQGCVAYQHYPRVLQCLINSRLVTNPPTYLVTIFLVFCEIQHSRTPPVSCTCTQPYTCPSYSRVTVAFFSPLMSLFLSLVQFSPFFCRFCAFCAILRQSDTKRDTKLQKRHKGDKSDNL